MSEKQRVKFTLTIELETEVPADWDTDSVCFYLEENHCIGNHIADLQAQLHERPDNCDMCERSTVKVVQCGLPVLEKTSK